MFTNYMTVWFLLLILLGKTHYFETNMYVHFLNKTVSEKKKKKTLISMLGYGLL